MNTIKVNNPELDVLVQHYAGSIAYGTNLPTSDVDIRGIFCGSRLQMTPPFYPIREVSIPEQEDGKLYELCNFMHLYTQGNPNILESLWVDKGDILSTSPAYDYLRMNAGELLSSKVAFTFSGYALSQLKRIKGHNRWINNPQPEKPPEHKDYLKLVVNFTEDKILPRDFRVENYYRDHDVVHYGDDIYALIPKGEGSSVITAKGDFNISCKQEKVSIRGVNPSFVFRHLKDEYRKAKEAHTNYWTWKQNRNESRAALEEKHGFDCKHAMHLVRLLRMGEEVLKGEGVIVKRPDAEELLAIRNGDFSYNEIVTYAESKDKEIRGDLYNRTYLRKTPNIALASKITTNIQDMYWESNYAV